MKNRRIIKQELNKNKIIIIIIIIVFICLNALILNYKEIKVFILSRFIKLEKIEIIVEQNTLEVGEKAQIRIKFYPDNANFYSYSLKSSNNDIIKIENNNTIEGINAGNAIVKLICNGKETEKNINVIIKAKEIKLENTEKSIKIGEKYQITAQILPEDASNIDLKYLSMNEEIATVNEFGEVEGKIDGETEIRILEQTEQLENSIKIIVLKNPVEKIEIDDNNVEIGKNEKYILTATVTPISATYKDIEWKSENENILIIDTNGIITTKNIGKTKVIAITDNGDKQAECVINVVNNPKETKKIYAKNKNAIRINANKNSTCLAITNEDEEIDLLKKLDNGWAKVKNKNGIVGYSLYSLYSIEKPISITNNETNISKKKVINNVPYLNQFTLGYPTGCEAVSATMVLKYAGYNVSADQLIEATPTDNRGKYYDNSTNSYYGGNPFKVFVGHPSNGKSKGSYGCFSEPIVTAMRKFAGNRVKNISGCSVDILFEYIDNGKPLVVWGIKNAGTPEKGVTWKYPDGSGQFEEIVGEHCFVLIGYDENYVFLNDPSAGQNVRQPKQKFINNWKQLYSQAIVIK